MGLPLLIVIVATSVATAADESTRRGLFVSPRAVDDVRRGGKAGTRLSYDVKEPLPAADTLAFIAESLAHKGWTPVMGSELPQNERSSLASGWDEPDRLHAGAGVHLWSSRWRDVKGNEVVYTLTYVCPLEQHGLHSSYGSVSARYYSKEEARRVRIESEAEVARISRRLKRVAPQASPQPCSN